MSKEQFEVWTLITWDSLSFPDKLMDMKWEISLLVEAILKTWWEILLDTLYKSKKASDLLDWSIIQKSNWLNVKENISKYLEKISKFLTINNYPKEHIEITSRKLWFELFKSWLNNLILSNWLSIPDKYIEVPENLKKQIYNILVWEEELSSLLIFLTSYWFIELSENIWNNFEEESENKVLDVDRDKLVADLKSLWAKKTFEWKVDDDYYDFLDMRLEESKKEWWSGSSFRIREKLDLMTWDVNRYYTIKRKKAENTEPSFRVCYEIEMRIKKIQWVLSILDKFWLKKFRDKSKDRVSFVIYDKDDTELGVKFDIDDYEKVIVDWKEVQIPTVLEIETNSKSLAEYYIKKLWLEWNVTLVSWSRWLFRYYANIDKKNVKKPKTIK